MKKKTTSKTASKKTATKKTTAKKAPAKAVRKSAQRRVPNPKGRNRLDKDKLRHALDLISEGRAIKDAIRQAGAAVSTIYAIQKRAKEQLEAGHVDSDDIQFLEQFEAAQARAINNARGVLWRCATEQDDWRAADCLLKRIDPGWSEATKVELSNPDGSMSRTDPKVTVNLVMSEVIDPAKSPFKEA